MDNIEREFEEYSKKHSILRKSEQAFNWRELDRELPYLDFPNDWEVKIIPPFLNGVIRFRVRLKGTQESVSVFLDCFDMMSFTGEPYWEIFPYVDGDCLKFLFKDTEDMLKAIDESLRYMQNLETRD